MSNKMKKLQICPLCNARRTVTKDIARAYFECGTVYFRANSYERSYECFESQIDQQAAEIERLTERNKITNWQPIETIPNSEYVDVWLTSKENTDFGVRVNACYDNGRWYGIPNCYNFDYVIPTYWIRIDNPEVK